MVHHIPVDTYACPDSYYHEKNYLLKKIGDNLNTDTGLNSAFNELVRLAHEGGFGFLNSDENDRALEKLSDQEGKVLLKLANRQTSTRLLP